MRRLLRSLSHRATSPGGASDRLRVLARWTGFCACCGDGGTDRPLVLTERGCLGLGAWWRGVGAEDRDLFLTCQLCGVSQPVPPEAEDPPVPGDPSVPIGVPVPRGAAVAVPSAAAVTVPRAAAVPVPGPRPSPSVVVRVHTSPTTLPPVRVREYARQRGG